MKKRTILIVEDNVALSHLQKEWLLQEGYEVLTAIDEPSARKTIAKGGIDLILSDVRLPKGDGISLLEWLGKRKPASPFVVMTDYASCYDAVKAVKMGAVDYLPKPIRKERLLELAREYLGALSNVQNEGKRLLKRCSPKMKEVERLAGLVAPSDISVLILGPNGTGKESVARSIHDNSARRSMPFVGVNCGAIPKELAASLFFGHRKGAFTGADANAQGYFETARGGTLFLDELGTLTPEVQTMLLRVLQENVFVPIGSNREVRADVRIVAATNEDLRQAIREGRFREDLFHRLNEFEIRQPSLAECPEDILPLADFFRKKFSKELRRETTGFTAAAERLLATYAWPGNVRELQNKVRRAVLLAEGPLLNAEDLNIKAWQDPVANDETLRPLRPSDEAEKQAIIAALKTSGGHRGKAAGLLNVNPATLYRKMKKHGLK